MTEAADWKGKVGEVWAEEWRRTDRSLAPVGDALIEAAGSAMAGVDAPAVLEVGCGAGTVALALADRLPEARITGVDLAEPLAAVARARAAGQGRVSFEAADASSWRPSDGSPFDLILSRHGVMFFDDPVAAFAHLHGLAAPAGRLLFSCFRPRPENPWVVMLDPILRRFAPETLTGPPPPTGPFAFGDPDRVAEILTQAGFAGPRFAPLDFDFVPGAGDDALADAVGYFQRIGPFAALIRALDKGRRADAIDQLRDILAGHVEGGVFRLRAAAWIVTAAAAR